ncbi:MAG: diguanylate cyclase [Gaiellaceae bacterium]
MIALDLSRRDDPKRAVRRDIGALCGLMDENPGMDIHEFDLRAYERLADLLPRLLAEETLDSLLEGMADAVEELIRCSALLLFELRAADRMLVPLVTRGLSAGSAQAAAVPEGANLEAVAVASAAQSGGAHDLEATAAVPLVVRGRTIGCLTVHRRGPGQLFHDEELRFLARLADVAAITLDNARTRARLSALAQTDELTGLLNRRGFFTALERALAQAVRDRRETSVLAVDLDELKHINDRHGHSVGDDAIVCIAGTLTARARRGDIVGRLGGDEFAVVLPGAGADAAEEFRLDLEGILRQARVETPAVTIVPCASFGIATAQPGEMGAQRLVAQADRDMYHSKGARKGRRAAPAMEM